MTTVGLPGLNAALAVAAHRNFKRAAAELGISPSALSHAIAELERQIGVRLFNRTTRSVALTEAGSAFLDRIRPALREISDAVEAVNLFRDTPRGTLRISLSEGAAERMLHQVILPFLRRCPDVKLDLVTDPRMVDIVAEGFDAGVRLAESVPHDMIAMACGPPQRFVVVAAPGYLTRRPTPVAPADLVGHDCIRRRFQSGSIYRWEFERHGEQLVIDVDGPLTIASDKIMIETALAGFGLAYVSEWSVAALLADGRLVSVLDDWLPLYPGLQLYYPSRRHAPASLRAFIEVVREAGANGWLPGPTRPPPAA